MSNIGEAPPDFTEKIGIFRLIAGDVNYVELDPPVSGQGDYTLFSDAEIQGYLDVSTGILSAVGYAYLALASEAARESELVKDFDLSVDLTKRAADLRAQAAQFFQRAAEEDSSSGDSLTIVPTGQQHWHWPELAPYPFGWHR